MKISCLHTTELHIIITCVNKVVLSKSQLHENLLFAHNRVAHRGRQKTEYWVKQNFAEVSQRVINLFVSLCRLHAEHKPITSRIKEVTNPLQAPSLLSMLEIDLMDFRNLPCTCRNPHKWVINLIDHHTKFVNSHPLHAKSADEVPDAVKNYCLSYGYPKKFLQTMEVNFAMRNSNYFARKIKSSCPMERQELQPHKVLWKEATECEVNNYGVK